MFVGTIGLFFFLLLLFIRFLPMIAISEMKGLVPASPQATGDAALSDAALSDRPSQGGHSS
jgi:molybdopterin-containing oxidoreductase family membrane subunit